MKKRIVKNYLFTYAVLFLTLLAFLPLFLILFQVIKNGSSSISLEFFTKTPLSPKSIGGGIAHALIGTIALATLASLFSFIPAILAGFYLAQFPKKKITQWILISLNILQTIPAIVIGIIVYLWIVKPMGGFSLLSGAVALSILMLPYTISASIEIFKLIPYKIHEAAYALGAPFYRVALKIILPTAMPGVASAALISLARAIGEAAPLLFTAFGNNHISLTLDEPTSALPLIIFKFGTSPYQNWKELAWGSSLVLLIFIILVNFSLKLFTKKKYTFS